MANLFHLTADAMVSPQASSSSGQSAIDTPIDEQLVLSKDYKLTIDLQDDAEVAVPLPGATENPAAPKVHVLMIKISGPRVKVKITTADGAVQIVPVSPLLVLLTEDVSPITALTLTRTPGNDTLCFIFLGQI